MATNFSKRTFRPYDIDDGLSKSLDSLTLSFGDQKCETGGRIRVNPDSFSERELVLNWAESSESFESFKSNVNNKVTELELDPKALVLVVNGESNYLKLTNKFSEDLPLNSISNLVRAMKLEPARSNCDRFVSGCTTHGFRVNVYIAVNEPQIYKSRPLPKGVFLTHVYFDINPTSFNLFHPYPLTSEDRERLELSNDVISFVELDTEKDWSIGIDDMVEPPKFWFDKELLDHLVQRISDPIGVYLQVQMLYEFIKDVIYRFSLDNSSSNDECEFNEESLIGCVCLYLAKRDKKDAENLFHDARTHPDKVISQLQVLLKVHKFTEDLLKFETK